MTVIGGTMKPKNRHPLLSKRSTAKFNRARSRNLFIAGLLVLLIIGYLVWSLSLSSPSTAPVTEISTTEQAEGNESIEAVDSTNDADVNLSAEVPSSANSTDTSSTVDSANTNIPSPKAIINAPIPATNSLAKEEIDRLDDQQQRLVEQQQQATEQVQMSKDLTELKAEQIKLLEQQIAQLERAESAQ